MSKNLIRRQSYLCAPLTWTPRIVYSDLPRYLSQGGEKELLATQLNKWIPWPREVAKVVKLDAVQQKLGYTWERLGSNIALFSKTTLFSIRWDRPHNLGNFIIWGHRSSGDHSSLNNRGGPDTSHVNDSSSRCCLAGKPSISFCSKEAPQSGGWLQINGGKANLQ